MPPSRSAIWSALLAVYVIWGSTYLGIKYAIGSIPPFLMAAARFLLSGIILYAFAIRRGDRSDKPGFPEWRSAFVLGFFMMVGGNGGVVWAQQHVTTGMASLLIATTPLWLSLMARAFLKEPISRSTAGGLLLGVVGVALLLDLAPANGHASSLAGSLAVLLAAFAWSAGSVYSRKATLPKRPLVGIALQMIAGGFLLLLISIFAGEPAAFEWSRVTGASLAGFVYLVFFGSLIGFSCYLWLLRVAPISLVSTYAFVNPVVALFLGWFFLNETLSPREIAGAAVILAAVGMIVRGKKPA
ncbi:MAG: EamA family transporter [Bdellovibrionota bacterium]